MNSPSSPPADQSHTVGFRDDVRIEILENTDFMPYGAKETKPGVWKLGHHHVTFTVGGHGIERLYTSMVESVIADGPTSDLIDWLLARINTSDVKFLKRFNVVYPSRPGSGGSE